MKAPVGTLQQAAMTEDRVVFVYRPDRQAGRGVLCIFVGLLLVALGILVGVKLASWWGWLVAILPLFAAAVAANWALAALIRGTLFQIEVDLRARTLAVSMPSGDVQALAKVRFSDVVAVEIGPKDRSWNVTLVLQDARRVGLGLSADATRADEVAARFSALLGVPTRRPSA